MRAAVDQTMPPLARGLAGLAVLVWCLSYGRTLIDESALAWLRPLDAFFRAGDLSVSVLLTVVGFVMTRTLLRAAAGRRRDVLASTARHLAMVAVVAAVGVLAVVVVDTVDDTARVGRASMRTIAVRVLTFTWNLAIRDDPLATRRDLTQLWVLSVEIQLVLVLALTVLLLGERPRLIGSIALASAILVIGYRVLAADELGFFHLALSTDARADGFLLGVAAAALSRRHRLDPATAAGWCGGALLALVGVVLSLSFVSFSTAFLYGMPVAAALAALFLIGSVNEPDPRSLVCRALSAAEVGAAGQWWRLVLVWAGPVVAWMSRHSSVDDGPLRLVLAGLVLALLTAASGYALQRLLTLAGLVEPTASEVRGEDRGSRGEAPPHP